MNPSQKKATPSKQRGHSSSRRSFLQQSASTAILASLGTSMVFADFFPAGLTPVGLLDTAPSSGLPGKHEGLTILNDRPINAETPPHLLDDELTPNDLFFVRNNGLPPSFETAGPAEVQNNWTLTVEGESARQLKRYTLAELKTRFTHHSYKLTLECGGNGRKEFNPPARGNQWSTGAVGCATWTGVRLSDVLEDVGIKADAKYIGYYGADKHVSGDLDKVVISRGVPIDKALQAESLIAWAMNGQDIPLLNGYPLRLVFGGYPASCSGKWLQKIVVRDRVHDGPKMTGFSYRVPRNPVAPGTEVAEENMVIIEKMPVKSLISFPKSGAMIRSGQQLPIRGHAWAAEAGVSAVHYSIDFGASWHACQLTERANRFAWQRFSAQVSFPQEGYYEVWAKATDGDGQAQPMVVPAWNPRGYLNNACHRIAVKVMA
ncbi:MAG: sulfite oxidase [Bacteroidota bacterium]